MEDTIFKLLKRLMLVVIGSGLLGNALYIHGLAYYQGYIGRFGFQYGFFPLPSTEVLFWTYSASRELGASSINAITQFKLPIFLTMLTVVYLISRLWMESSNKNKRQRKLAPRRHKIKLYKKIHSFKKHHKVAFYAIYVPLRWLVLKEQSLMAFVASYFSLIAIFFLPIFLFIWVYFPMIGVEHGRSVAELRIEYYKDNLCGSEDSYWSACMIFPTAHIGSREAPEVVSGRLILRSDNLLGVYTEVGPVTMSMPDRFYHLSSANDRYKDGVDKRKEEGAEER